MRQLLWKELFLSKWYIMFFIFFIPFSYGVNVPIVGLNIWIMLGFVFFVFYTDSHNTVDQYLASIPIKRETLVAARYLFLFLLACCFSLYLWIIDYLAHYGLPFLENKPITGLGIVGLFTLLSVVLSIAIPIFYYFRSFQRAMTVFMVLAFFVAFFIGIFSADPTFFLENTIGNYVSVVYEFQPYLLLLGLSILSLYVSSQISARLFLKKDIR